jgi:hypothetical protein
MLHVVYVITRDRARLVAHLRISAATARLTYRISCATDSSQDPTSGLPLLHHCSLVARSLPRSLADFISRARSEAPTVCRPDIEIDMNDRS